MSRTVDGRGGEGVVGGLFSSGGLVTIGTGLGANADGKNPLLGGDLLVDG